jgi:hypothetical protein
MASTPPPNSRIPSAEEKLLRYSGKWSTRLLILSLLGIFFLTLLPFRFNFHATVPNHRHAFQLGGSGKSGNPFPIFLNVLLFMPFGFGLAEALRERGKSRMTVLAWGLVFGAALSYTVEFLQLYIPTRDSGWEDVFTNGTGSLLGSVVFELLGNRLLGFLALGESLFASILKWPRAIAVVALYFGLWIVFSVPLQRQSSLDNWTPEARLLIGNGVAANYQNPWKGEIETVQIWNLPLNPDTAAGFSGGKDLRRVRGTDGSSLVATFNFASPDHAGENSLPPSSSWSSHAEISSDHQASVPIPVTLDGKSWLTSNASNLVEALRKTNRFAIRIVCRPAAVTEIDAAIVSISRPDGAADLEIAQSKANAVFVLRTPLNTNRYNLDWSIPDVFVADQPADLLFSYDGSNVLFYLNGKPSSAVYRLGPGVALASFFRHIKTGELNGYNDIYYFMIFFIGGALLGISIRSIRGKRAVLLSFLCLGFIVPALLLELSLISLSGRPFSWQLVLLSITFAVAGALWINADSTTITPHGA